MGKSTHFILYLVNEKKRKSRGKGDIFFCVIQLSISLRKPWLLHSYMSAYEGNGEREALMLCGWAPDSDGADLKGSQIVMYFFQILTWQMGWAVYVTCASLPGVCFWVRRGASGGITESPAMECPAMLSHLLILKANFHLTFISWFWQCSLFRPWRAESARRGLCEWQASAGSCPSTNCGLGPPGCEALWYFSTTPCQPWLCKQDPWQVSTKFITYHFPCKPCLL